MMHQPRALVVLLAAVAIGCGGKTAPKVDAATPPQGGSQQLNGGSASSNCKSASDCPKITQDVQSNGFSSTGGLLGVVDEPVPWNFIGVATESAGRRVAVLLNNIPSGAKVEPEISDKQVHTEVKIVWTPSKKMKSTKDLEIHLRDLDRCLQELDAERCNNGKKSLPDYDKVMKVKWQIENKGDVADGSNDSDQNVVDIAGDDCGPAPTTDSDIKGKILQGAIGVLTGGAGGLPQLLPGLLSSISGGGSNNSTPQECTKPTTP